MSNIFSKIIRPYAFFISMVLFNLFWFFIDAGKTLRATEIFLGNISEMLMFLPPIFLLLGLLDVWTDRERMMRLMGKGSGLRGIMVSFMIGSFAAGPLYVAFPIASVMLRKGASIFNVFIFIGAWSITKIPMLLFESSTLGMTYTSLRLLINIPAIIGIAWLMQKILGSQGEAEVLKIAVELEKNQ